MCHKLQINRNPLFYNLTWTYPYIYIIPTAFYWILFDHIKLNKMQAFQNEHQPPLLLLIKCQNNLVWAEAGKDQKKKKDLKIWCQIWKGKKVRCQNENIPSYQRVSVSDRPGVILIDL